jgi:hypothetical protein
MPREGRMTSMIINFSILSEVVDQPGFKPKIGVKIAIS